MHAKRWLVAELGRETNFFEVKVINSREGTCMEQWIGRVGGCLKNVRGCDR